MPGGGTRRILVALADIRACVQDMEGGTKVAAQAYTCAEGGNQQDPGMRVGAECRGRLVNENHQPLYISSSWSFIYSTFSDEFSLLPSLRNSLIFIETNTLYFRVISIIQRLLERSY